MNEFIAKKLGEVLAFTRVGIDTVQYGKVALTEALGEEKVADMLEKNRLHGESIEEIARAHSVSDTTLTKADKTEAKLKQMRDLYVGDEWHNAVELLEWSGFFEGAAIVHWNLVKGGAQALNNEPLIELCDEGIDWHRTLLEMAESELEQEGSDKASIQ